MRAVVVYESMFGNTRDLAAAMVGGLTARGACIKLIPIAQAPVEFDGRVDLLIAGAPTHAFGLPKQQTRADAARRGAGAPMDADGLREWIERVRLERGQPAATFDTRIDRPRLPGSAARAAARRLRDRGATILCTQSFHVRSMEGPLVDGELDRARAWAAGLVLDAAIHRVS